MRNHAIHGERLKSLHLQFPWSPKHIDPKYTGAHSTRQRITRQCVWSRAVLPVVFIVTACHTKFRQTGSDKGQAQTNTDRRARESRAPHDNKTQVTSQTPTCIVYPPSRTNCLTPSKKPEFWLHRSPASLSNPPVVVRTRQWNRNFGTKQGIIEVVGTSYTAVLC